MSHDACEVTDACEVMRQFVCHYFYSFIYLFFFLSVGSSVM